MKNLFLSLFLVAGLSLLFSCDSMKDEKPEICIFEHSGVLMLVVDYTTNTFEGGKYFVFNQRSEKFTISNEYKEPGDFGYVKLYYSEINQLLFHGEIIWQGSGKMIFPEKLLPAKDFEQVGTDDLRSPKNGYENIFNSNDLSDNFGEKVWGSVQGLVAARTFLGANPEQKVKYFLYTPSVGVGNPKEWKWVIFLKA